MRRSLAGIVTALLAGALLLVPGTASANVSSTPALTPQLGTSGNDGSIEQVRQIVQCGGTMYAVGRFSQVKNGGSSALIARNNAFSFSATAPYRVTGWNPNVNGQVETVECGPSGSILLGGQFTRAGGATVSNLAKVNGTTGAAMAFATGPSAIVHHLEVVLGHLLVGGSFPGYLRSVSPTTGQPDGYGMPTIAGTYQFPGAAQNRTQIYNMSVRSDQLAVLMTGVFTSVNGQRHEQIFRLNMTRGAATPSAWEPTELRTHCATVQPFYAQDAAYSPDGRTIFTATTGFKPFDRPTNVPRSGPCDAVIAWQALNQAPFAGHNWINYSGCDSFYSVATDSATVFAGGHQRWANNPNGCDHAGPGAVAHPGLGEFSPTTGALQAGPNRGRGLGAKDLLRTSAGLWVASDNQANTDQCAGQSGHMGICFLPN